MGFAKKYLSGDERKIAVSELLQKADQTKNTLTKSSSSVIFVAAREIARHGKPLSDGEYI